MDTKIVEYAGAEIEYPDMLKEPEPQFASEKSTIEGDVTATVSLTATAEPINFFEIGLSRTVKINDRQIMKRVFLNLEEPLDLAKIFLKNFTCQAY